MAKLNVKTPNGTTKSIDLDKVLLNSDITSSSTNGSISVKGTNVSVYTHPTTNGNKHIPANGGSNQILRYSAAGTAAWSNERTYAANGESLALSGTAFKIKDGQIIQHASIAKGTNPSANLWSEFLWCDNSTSTSNDHRISGFSRGLSSDGVTHCRFLAYDSTSGATGQDVLGIAYPKGGTPYTYAPTPAAGDSSAKIATTQWVGMYGGVTACSKGNSGYIKFKSGLMIQWGRQNTTYGDGSSYIDFPIEFPHKPLRIWAYNIHTGTGTPSTLSTYSFTWFYNMGYDEYATSDDDKKIGATFGTGGGGDVSLYGWCAIGY